MCRLIYIMTDFCQRSGRNQLSALLSEDFLSEEENLWYYWEM